MISENQIAEAIRSDLAGENGEMERETTLRALMRLREEQMLDALTCFGTDGVQVMSDGNGMMISNK